MINLIPNEEKKKKVKDFYFRLMVTSFMVLGLSLIVTTVAILPAYFLSAVKKNLIVTRLEMQRNTPLPAVRPETTVLAASLRHKLDLVEKASATKYDISTRVLQEILKAKMSDVKLNRILYLNEPSRGRMVNLFGTAPSRERLLLFSRALEATNAFKKVDLPVSNFIRGSNIEFSLSIIPL